MVSDDRVDEASDEGFKPLTREEAVKIRASNPPVSLWWVVAGQAIVGVLVAVAAWLFTGQARMGWSAGYGALAVVIPAALFARGLSRQKAATQGGAALAGFFVWELVKIALTVAMLFAAPRLIAQLSWLALLAGFVVTMKVYWVAVWLRPGRKESIKKF
ncbi:ATP synthase subunit I [Polaromonas sp. OV174]|uniref:ATP synthase subunit I n=1 Tax=Polaromonas sp. OV174 TaxID=1855300 RepID=UPI000B88876A|nr:ATP synthase subunit I [Polaromonas sp. OV174]